MPFLALTCFLFALIFAIRRSFSAGLSLKTSASTSGLESYFAPAPPKDQLETSPLITVVRDDSPGRDHGHAHGDEDEEHGHAHGKKKDAEDKEARKKEKEDKNYRCVTLGFVAVCVCFFVCVSLLPVGLAARSSWRSF